MSEREEIAKRLEYLVQSCFYGGNNIGKIADWHIAELAKAKREGKLEILNQLKPSGMCDQIYIDDLYNSIINEEK